jgi:hypothetical protein
MSDDWNIGDLAVCVDDSPRYPSHRVLVENGRVYRVSGLSQMSDGEPSLFLDGVIGWLPGEEKPWPYRAHRFRKIRPDALEECEAEFVTLLKRTKVKANA